MHKSTWKKREAAAAKLFGARRQRLSGSSGRDDTSASDSTHERLYVETKIRSSSSMISLYDKTREQAKREKKIPVLLLTTKGRAGFIIACDVADLALVAAELAEASRLTHEELETISPESEESKSRRVQVNTQAAKPESPTPNPGPPAPEDK